MDYQEALEFVRTYYEQTWDNLLWLLAVAFGVIGVIMGIVVPLIIQWIQSKNNKKQNKELKKVLEKLIDSKLDEINKKYYIIQKDLLFVQGCMYVTQGNLLMKSEIGDEGATKIMHSFLYAAFCFLNADQNDNLKFVIQTLIRIMTSQDFPKKIPATFEGIDVREVYDITLALFEKNNGDGKYTTLIQMLKEIIIFYS